MIFPLEFCIFLLIFMLHCWYSTPVFILHPLLWGDILKFLTRCKSSRWCGITVRVRLKPHFVDRLFWRGRHEWWDGAADYPLGLTKFFDGIQGCSSYMVNSRQPNSSDYSCSYRSREEPSFLVAGWKCWLRVNSLLVEVSELTPHRETLPLDLL